jgi:hypothetical protein
MGEVKVLSLITNLGITINNIKDIQTTCAKVGSQNENSREHILRFPKWLLSENKDVLFWYSAL